MIPLHKPFLTENELRHVERAITSLGWSGEGAYVQQCSEKLAALTGCPVLLTSSGTSALELALMALHLNPGDEIILPSYTFTSTANSAVQMGLIPVFVDIQSDTLNIDAKLIEQAISEKTKAILAVHYAGVAAEMDDIISLAKKFSLAVIEDAAHGINAFYKGRSLGSLGDLGTFSFHQTKNLSSGEGGAIVVPNEKYLKTIEIHRQKGTNRDLFLLGQVDKYSWIDRGSNYLMSNILAALLFAQLEAMEEVTERRKRLWARYYERLTPIANGRFRLPSVPKECDHNAHIFFIILEEPAARDNLKTHLRRHGIEAVSHFIPLHDSPGGKKFGIVRGPMDVTLQTAETLLRLPLYTQMSEEEQDRVIHSLQSFFNS